MIILRNNIHGESFSFHSHQKYLTLLPQCVACYLTAYYVEGNPFKQVVHFEVFYVLFYVLKALFLWGTTSKAHSERLQAAWSWGKEQTNAFEALKEALSGAPALAWLRLDAPTCVISDASPVGLGAIPQQDKGTGERILIVYISRSLTLTERRLTLTQQISYRLYHPSKFIFPILVSFVKTTQDLFSHQICMSDLQAIVLVFPNYAEIYASTIY